MPSFRTIFLAAAMAFAAFSSAAPVEDSSLVARASTNGITSLVDAVTSAEPTKRDNAHSVPQIFQTCHDGVADIIIEIKAAVDVKDGKALDHDLIVTLLYKVLGVLKVVLADLKVLVDAKLDVAVLLTLDGVLWTVADLGKLIAGILVDLFVVILLVAKVLFVADVAVALVLKLVLDLLAEILLVVFGLLVGLEVVVLKALVVVAVDLKLLLEIVGHLKIFALLKIVA